MAGSRVSRENRKPIAIGEHINTFDDGWELRVTLRPGKTMTASLRRDDDVYTLISADTSLMDLFATGYDVDMSVDNLGRPTVLWRPSPGSSPFVWFCGIGVADWSRPL